MTYSLRIDVYSHNLVVSGASYKCKEALFHFNKRMGQFGKEKVNGQWVWKILRTFSGFFADRRQFCFHINQYDDLIDHLARYQIYKKDIFEVEHAPVEGEYYPNMSLLDHLKPRDYQVPLVDYFVSEKYEPNNSPIGNLKQPTFIARSKTTTLQTGMGKSVPLDCPVKIPGGWKLMTDIKVGDMVTAADGTATKVLGVYPQGPRQMYNIHLADGRVVEADGDHLWKFFYQNTVPHRQWQINTTKEMIRLKNTAVGRVYLPLCQSENIPDVDLPIDPYVLGVILGDGAISHGDINIHKPDVELHERVASRLPDDCILKYAKENKSKCLSSTIYHKTTNSRRFNRVVLGLHSLGLMGKRAWEKFVPEIYLHASTEQRLEVVRGLMDTDGFACKQNSIDFCSTSYELAANVVYLIRSLGGMAHITTKQPHYTYKGERLVGRTAYIVNIRYPRPSELFSLNRKKDRLNDNNQYGPTMKLRVDKIEPGRIAEAQCILVEHPEHLFVMKDFVVTHNTLSTLFAVAQIKRRTVFTMLGGYIPKWVGDIKGAFGCGNKDIIVVQGFKDLRDLIELGKAKAITEPFIIISNKTYYQFIQHYETSNGDTDLYGCSPHELMTILNAGLLVKDEVHQDLHLNFRMDLYMHVWKSINLSATLESDDKFINQIYALQFLKDYRFKGYAYDKYVHIRAMTYNIQPHMVRKVRCQNFSYKSYSHVMFEESIMRIHSLRNGYLLMITEIIKNEFVSARKENQKMLIYFATTEFCTLATQYFKEMFPSLVVKRKIQEDPFQNLHTADLIVSTLKSAGTAQDIPGLIRVLMTDSVNSRQINLQALGRLRKMEGTDLYFMYLVCLNIPKQVDYHRHKLDIFSDKALTHTERSTGKHIG